VKDIATASLILEECGVEAPRASYSNAAAARLSTVLGGCSTVRS
jgi:hypothetical protein